MTTPGRKRAGKQIKTSGEPHVAGRVNALQLPHERDETTEAPAPIQHVIVQAEQDVAAGQVDTDNYTRARAVANRGKTTRR